MTAALEGDEWSAARPGPGNDHVAILKEARGGAPGPVWTSGKSRPHWDSMPDRPARSSVVIPTERPGPIEDSTCLSLKVTATYTDPRFSRQQCQCPQCSLLSKEVITVSHVRMT